MKNPNLNELRRAWVGSMARTGMPHSEIAFKLGLSLEELRLTFADDMQHVSQNFKARVYQTLAKQAVCGKYPSATIFWMKEFYLPKSGLKNSRKSNKDNEKQRTWGWGEPEEIVFRGPNGETEDDPFPNARE